MARPLRIEYPEAYYYVMNRGLSRGVIFLDNYHLLLQTPRVGLSRSIRHLDGV